MLSMGIPGREVEWMLQDGADFTLVHAAAFNGQHKVPGGQSTLSWCLRGKRGKRWLRVLRAFGGVFLLQGQHSQECVTQY